MDVFGSAELRAMQQQMSGLGGALGGQLGGYFGSPAQQQAIPLPEGYDQLEIRFGAEVKQLSFIDKLRYEIDEWLNLKS